MDEAYPEVERWRATVEGASALPIPEGQRSVEVLSHGTMVVKYYAPLGRNEQTPIPETNSTLWPEAAAPSSTEIKSALSG